MAVHSPYLRGSMRKQAASKVQIRQLKEKSAARHILRLHGGLVAGIQTCSLHLDNLRYPKRINAHIAAITYSILDRQAELRNSRMVANGTSVR
jgi:phosphate:Na+ symporter